MSRQQPAAVEFDQETSKDLARRVEARPRECWRNAVLALAALPAARGAVYVEGYIVAREGIRFPIEHGWLEVAGQIVDPTLTEGGFEYFAGPRYRRSTVLGAVKRGGLDLPIVYGAGQGLQQLRCGFGGMQSPEYRAAYQAANAACRFPDISLNSVRLLAECLSAAEQLVEGSDRA